MRFIITNLGYFTNGLREHEKDLQQKLSTGCPIICETNKFVNNSENLTLITGTNFLDLSC